MKELYKSEDKSEDLTAPPVFQGEATIYRGNLGGKKGFSFNGLSTSNFRAILTGDQTLGSSAVTKMQFNVLTYDGLGEFLVASYRFVAQSDGRYDIHAQVYIDTTNLADQKELGIILKKNGSNFVSSVHQTSGVGAVTIKVNDRFYLDHGDYIEVFVNNSIASNLTAIGDTALTYFTGHRLP